MNTNELTVLFRPVGQKELDLIARDQFRSFPPRLEGQPIFYPVLNEEYATFIAREWNTKDPASGFIGYVLKFAVRSEYLTQFEVQKVGSASALELWIPAEQLAEFNQNIIGKIEVVSTYRGESLRRTSRSTSWCSHARQTKCIVGADSLLRK